MPWTTDRRPPSASPPTPVTPWLPQPDGWGERAVAVEDGAAELDAGAVPQRAARPPRHGRHTPTTSPGCMPTSDLVAFRRAGVSSRSTRRRRRVRVAAELVGAELVLSSDPALAWSGVLAGRHRGVAAHATCASASQPHPWRGLHCGDGDRHARRGEQGLRERVPRDPRPRASRSPTRSSSSSSDRRDAASRPPCA